jgi:hypothetical protein
MPPHSLPAAAPPVTLQNRFRCYPHHRHSGLDQPPQQGVRTAFLGFHGLRRCTGRAGQRHVGRPAPAQTPATVGSIKIRY